MLHIDQNITKSVKTSNFIKIDNGEKYHYLAVTSLSSLLQRISSNYKEDFYCLNCFNSYTTKNKLKEHEEICNNHDSCQIEMPDWVNKTIKYIKSTIFIFSWFRMYIKKLQSSQNNPEKSYTEKS